MELDALSLDDCSPEDFVRLLEGAELSQREYARLSGFHIATVNRYCSLRDRADRLAVPRHAVMLAVQFALLSVQARRFVRSLIQEPAPPEPPAPGPELASDL